MRVVEAAVILLLEHVAVLLIDFIICINITLPLHFS
jgi:hypothetical protein